MNRIGTTIYYCTLTGNILVIKWDREGAITDSTIEQDMEIYEHLQGRLIDTIGILTFEFGEYAKVSEGSIGAYVDLDTKELVFEYPVEPPQKPTIEEKMEEYLKSILRGEVDMQSLAYALYPKDFEHIENKAEVLI